MKVITAISIMSGAVLIACASKPTAESIQKEQLKAEELRDQADAAKAKKRQSQNEDFIEGIPAWALQPPRPDAEGMYAVGGAESVSLNIAQKKAMLDAEFGLAKQYRQELSGSERSYTQERNDRSLTNQYTQLIDKLVARVPVVGFEVVKQEVKSVHGTFHSWLLLKLPYAQFNRILQEQRAESVEASVQKEFDELDRRLKVRAIERLQEQQDQQSLRRQNLSNQVAPLDGKEKQVAVVASPDAMDTPRTLVVPVDASVAGKVQQ
jgi:hypothetical protein